MTIIFNTFYGDNGINNGVCDSLDITEGLVSVEKLKFSDSRQVRNLKFTFDDGETEIVPCSVMKANEILELAKNRKARHSNKVIKAF